MAIQFGAKAIIQEVGKYGFGVVTGGGIVLASLFAWTGTSDLNLIKEGVSNYITKSEQNVSALASEYWGVVDSANAEIGAYQKALEEANGNITKLVEAYQDQKGELEALEKQIAEQYVSVEDTNEIIAKANAEIQSANDEVKATSTEVYGSLINSQMNIDKTQALNNAKGDSQNLQTGGDKTVQDISSIVPTEEPTEEPQE